MIATPSLPTEPFCDLCSFHHPHAVLHLPTKKKGETWILTPERYQQWLSTYTIQGRLDVATELVLARDWLQANPRRRKSNVDRFLVGWLQRRHRQVMGAVSKSRGRL